NRTVKRLRADDSAATSVKVGNRQACVTQSPSSNELGLFALRFGFCTAPSQLASLYCFPSFFNSMRAV
ncbi:hypothetical protein ACFQUU_25860, partial [Herbaspirillum sp. GCM10030257]|uniref:hypothetical protein n=1 Tax=Herbaspirillum sp. GCM10030257 TaxID=3273393 RepID=UPI003616C8ED